MSTFGRGMFWGAIVVLALVMLVGCGTTPEVSLSGIQGPSLGYGYGVDLTFTWAL